MRVERLSPLGDPRWLEFVEDAPDATVFHHPAWLGLLARRYRYPMSAVCVLDGDRRIVAGLPLARVESRLTGKRLVALPFSDACGPAHAPGAGGEATQALSEAIATERRRTGLDVEVRERMDGLARAHVVTRFLTHALALEADPDAALAHAKGQARRDAAKARREGVVAERRRDRQALRDFYGLHLATRRRHGVPTQPKGFILALEQLFARGLGFVIVARHEGRPIAAAVFMTFAGTLTYKYSASDPEFLRLRPNHLFMAEAIRHGCELGLDSVDFGRTDIHNKGLASFKRSWGATERELAYTYLADRPPASRDGVAGRLISAAVRRGPKITGRLIGAALYRHVG
jgi:CelD/BcsL family acetyltransferase involved in cellulose biosynthesis